MAATPSTLIVDYDTMNKPTKAVENMIDWLRSSSDNWDRFRYLKAAAESQGLSDEDARCESIRQGLKDQYWEVDSRVIKSLLQPRPDAFQRLQPSIYSTLECDPATYQRFIQRSPAFKTIEGCGGNLQTLDASMGFPAGMSKKLLRWNTGPRNSFIIDHPGSASTEQLQLYKGVELLVRQNKSMMAIVRTLFDSRFMVDEFAGTIHQTWKRLYPHIQLNHTVSFFEDHPDLLAQALETEFYKSKMAYLSVEEPVL